MGKYNDLSAYMLQVLEHRLQCNIQMTRKLLNDYEGELCKIQKQKAKINAIVAGSGRTSIDPQATQSDK